MQVQALPWKGAPTARLVALSWPICLSTISYAVYTIVDTWFVAELGDESLAAVSLGGVLCFSLIWFGRGVLASVKLKVSQDIGAKREENLDAWVIYGMRLALVLALTIGVAGLALAWLIPSLADTAPAGSLASQYFLIRLSGIGCCLFAATLREGLFGEGESRIPLWASLASSASNVAFDAFFVLQLSWGVQGVALATALAYLVDLWCCFGEISGAGRPRDGPRFLCGRRWDFPRSRAFGHRR